MLSGEHKPVVGTPFIEGAAVEATVVSHRGGDKLIVFKFEPRKRKRRKIGHRQQLSELRIGVIRAPGQREETAASRPSAAGAETTGKPRASGKTGRSRKPAQTETEATTEE
jgi:large subunit ribosomal protein L21